MNSQAMQAVVNTIDCSWQTAGKTPLLMTIPTGLDEHEKVKQVPTKMFHSYVLDSLLEESNLLAAKGETETPTEPQTL